MKLKLVEWYDVVVENKYQLNHENIGAVGDMKSPFTADKICQFIHFYSWIAHSVPKFHACIPWLNDILEANCKAAGN